MVQVEMQIATLVTIGSLIGATVWAVSKIKTIAAVLVERVGNLTSSMEKLEGTVAKVDDDFKALDRRVMTLETKALMKDQTHLLATEIVKEIQKVES